MSTRSLWIVLLLLVGCSPLSSQPVPSVGPAACVYRGKLPDPACTPGAINPAVTQDNIGTTICASGWTATVRPSSSYTNQLKAQQLRQYGLGDQPPSGFEEDHLIPLELGGAPSDPRNLWPEPGPIPNPKDRVENELHALVCDGKMRLAEAQRRISIDWTTALP